MDRGNTYYAPTGETTEWEDILIKKGIISPKEKPYEEEEEEEYEERTLQETLEDKSVEELEELEDDFNDDDEELILQRIRAKRLAEMKARAAKNIYGTIEPITKDEWTTQVNEASKKTWVIVYLYDYAVEQCKLMDELLRVVAKKHPALKFVSIASQACIENWPAKNLPTLFLYKDGELQDQLLTLNTLSKMNTKVQDLEDYLMEKRVIVEED